MKKGYVEDEDMLFSSAESNVRIKNITCKQYTIYLDKLISEPCTYRDAVDALESAQPCDEVRIIILSGGGQINTGLTLIDYIKACQAPTVAYMHEECASMATGIALACDNWIIGDFAHFMIHTASLGIIGKASEVKSQHDFMENYIDRFLKKIYSGFLTLKEIKAVAKGEDIWIDNEELKQRLTVYAQWRITQQTKEARKFQKQRRQEKMDEQKSFDADSLPQAD